jgi:hypothetical protein
MLLFTLLKRPFSARFIFALILVFGFSHTGIAQKNLDDVDLELIPHRSVREYLLQQKKNNIIQFIDIKPTWCEPQKTSEYNIQKRTYTIKENISKVWSKYQNTSPAKSWNGKKVMFGFMFSKKQDEALYAGDEFTGIDTGQVIFLNLKLLKFYNLAMAFEIISVDAENKIIEFSYIEGNVSHGKQCLQFLDTPEGYTQIIHSSYFKSESKLRDKFLYPFFHARTTNEFHRIMKRLIRDNNDMKDLFTLN